MNPESDPMFSFIRVVDGVAKHERYAWSEGATSVRQALAESLNAKNVAFLLGAGCSSSRVKTTEVGIPTMAHLAKEFTNLRDRDDQHFPTTADCVVLSKHFGIDIRAEPYSTNLERLVEILFSIRFTLTHSSCSEAAEYLKSVESLIDKIRAFILDKCTKGEFSNGDTTVMTLYESFYRNLVFRDRSLPRPWIFTTNYDLFNETAMDRLGLPFANGFSGIIERRFNPAMFRYALAEQLDLTSRKWSAVDGFVYLCKLHGSINWIEDDHGLFPIRETGVSNGHGRLIIYPTPAKQHAVLASPYADLFRQFQSRIVQEQSVLFTMGYAFGDEHVNNIIYQALTIPTFRLVIFADPTMDGEISKLINLNDPRIWIIGGEGPQPDCKAHYFETIVRHFMPQQPSDRIDQAVKNVLKTLSSSPKGSSA